MSDSVLEKAIRKAREVRDSLERTTKRAKQSSPKPNDREQRSLAQRLEVANNRIEGQRKLLAEKDQRIFRLQQNRLPQRKPGRLPDFVIIGAQKCGTTFLYHLLGQHPQIELADAKELDYFSHRFKRGIEWYRTRFPPLPKTGKQSVTGEASPNYLYYPHTARRMAEVLPQARLIALLRDPVDRAYSNYHHMVREGHEILSFEEAVEAEEGRIKDKVDKMLADEDYVDFDHAYHAYISRGRYIEQIDRYFKFFPKDNVLVLKSEDLHRNTLESLQQVLRFLSLPSWEPEDVAVPANEGSYPPMSPATKEMLRSYFEPYNEKLYKRLGKDFDW